MGFIIDNIFVLDSGRSSEEAISITKTRAFHRVFDWGKSLPTIYVRTLTFPDMPSGGILFENIF